VAAERGGGGDGASTGGGAVKFFRVKAKCVLCAAREERGKEKGSLIFETRKIVG
jgi:hypothetical protein